MAVKTAAALLDELMGRNRNSLPNQQVKELHWDDDEVCKHYLCGFCPHDVFTNTRADLGPCANIHDDELRKAYEKSTRYFKMGYEADLVRFVQENVLVEVDRKIKRGQARLALNASGATAAAASTPQNAREEKIALLTAKINDLVEKAEALGFEGKVEEAQGVMKLCDQLREDRSNLEFQEYGGQTSNQSKEMEVCLVCGAFVVKNDTPQRVEEHVAGKQHAGYAKVRDYIKAYNSGQLKRRESNGNRDKDTSRDRERDRQRDKERDDRYKKDEEDRVTVAKSEEERKEFEARVRREKEEIAQQNLADSEAKVTKDSDRDKDRRSSKKRSRSRSKSRRRSRDRDRKRSRERSREKRPRRDDSRERRKQRDDSRERRKRRDDSRDRRRRSRSSDRRRRSRSRSRDRSDRRRQDSKERRRSRERDDKNRKRSRSRSPRDRDRHRGGSKEKSKSKDNRHSKDRDEEKSRKRSRSRSPAVQDGRSESKVIKVELKGEESKSDEQLSTEQDKGEERLVNSSLTEFQIKDTTEPKIKLTDGVGDSAADESNSKIEND